MVFLFPVLFVGWKLIKKTKIVKAHEADLVTETNTFNRVLDKLFG
jgi:amino acid transporter